MTNSTSDANPAGVQEEAGEVSSNPRDLIASGLGLSNKPETPEEPKEEPKVVSEAEEPEEPESTEEETTEEESEETEEVKGDDISDVLSQYDFTASSDEDIKALGQWFSENLGDKASIFGEGYGSGAGKEFGKLRGEIRQRDSRIESLEAQLQEATQNFQPSDNAWSNVNDLDELSNKEEQVKANIQAANEFLSGDEDYITAADGKEYDRKTVSSWLNDYIKQMADIPVQRQRIKELSSIDKDAEFKKAQEEIEWLSDEESENYKAYKDLLDNADIQLFATSFPKTGAKLKRLLAHSVNSMSSPKTAKANISLTKRSPSSANTVSSGAGSARQSGNPNGKLRDKAWDQIRSGDRKKGVRNLIAASI